MNKIWFNNYNTYYFNRNNYIVNIYKKYIDNYYQNRKYLIDYL